MKKSGNLSFRQSEWHHLFASLHRILNKNRVEKFIILLMFIRKYANYYRKTVV